MQAPRAREVEGRHGCRWPLAEVFLSGTPFVSFILSSPKVEERKGGSGIGCCDARIPGLWKSWQPCAAEQVAPWRGAVHAPHTRTCLMQSARRAHAQQTSRGYHTPARSLARLRRSTRTGHTPPRARRTRPSAADTGMRIWSSLTARSTRTTTRVPMTATCC